MTASKRDIIAGGVFGIGAVVLFAVASGYPVRSGQPVAVSPGFYPRILAMLMAVLSLIQIISAVAATVKAGKKDVPAEEPLPGVWKDRNAFLLFCLTLGSLILYPFLMELLGFALTGFLFLGTLIYALSAGHRKGKALALIAALTLAITLLTYLVFRLFLRIPFPSGIFGP